MIGNGIFDSLDNLLDLTKRYCDTPDTHRKNRILRSFRTIMTEGTKESTYSATAATTLLNAPDYTEIKQLFTNQKLWTADFIELEKQVRYCVL